MKLKIIVIGISFLLITSIIISAIIIHNDNTISKSQECQLMNKCCYYVTEYLETIPSENELTESIKNETSELLTSGIFDDFFKYSDFNIRLKNDLKSNKQFSEFNDEYKESYYCEIMILRLKSLAITGDSKNYKKEFLKYFSYFESNTFTFNKYALLFYNDKNIPINYNDDVYCMFVQSYNAAIDMCSKEIDKYMLLKELSVVLEKIPEAKMDCDVCLDEIKTITDSIGADNIKEQMVMWKGINQ